MIGLAAKTSRALRYGDALLHIEQAQPTIAEIRRAMILATLATAFYGAVMGSYGRIEGAAGRQIVYSAIKTPLLLGATFALTLPSFVVINSLLGLRKDLPAALSAIVASQAVVAIALASLAPLTMIWYLTVRDYNVAILFNAAVFAAASVAGQRALRVRYASLIEQNPAHRWLLRVWIGVYAFVGIQSGWVMRPFVGKLGMPAEFLRPEKWDNAYVIVGRIIWNVLSGHQLSR